MATPNYELDVLVRDSENKTSSMKFYGQFLTDAAARTAAGNLVNAIALLTDGVVAMAKLGIVLQSNGATPAGNVDNEIKATFSFTDPDGRLVQVSIPAFDRAYLLPNSDSVDLTNADVLDFTDNVVTELWVSSYALDLTGVASGVESFTKRQKARG